MKKQQFRFGIFFLTGAFALLLSACSHYGPTEKEAIEALSHNQWMKYKTGLSTEDIAAKLEFRGCVTDPNHPDDKDTYASCKMTMNGETHAITFHRIKPDSAWRADING